MASITGRTPGHSGHPYRGVSCPVRLMSGQMSGCVRFVRLLTPLPCPFKERHHDCPHHRY